MAATGALAAASRWAGDLGVAFHLRQLPVQLGDAALDETAVHLQLFLTRSSGSDTASQTGEELRRADESRLPVFELGQLYLNLTFAGPGVGRENIQDNQSPIHDFEIQLLLQVVRAGPG